jgi:hypothetical protein
MAKKSMVKGALDEAKSVAGAALAAAAVAATGVVVSRVAGKLRKGGKQLNDATPSCKSWPRIQSPSHCCLREETALSAKPTSAQQHGSRRERNVELGGELLFF